MAVTFQQDPKFGQLMTELTQISNKGRFNEMPKLPDPPKPKLLKPFSGLPLSAWGNGSSSGVTGGTGLPGGSLGSLMNAIRSQESNHNYRAINPHSGALGAYQIMPFNLFGGSEWDRKALGRDVSRSEFLSNRGIQDAIARWQLGNYLKKYGAAGAAVAWYGGPGAVRNMHSRTTQRGGYPSLYAYWNSVLSKMR